MATPLRVLILEDVFSDAELIVRALRDSGYEPTWQLAETEQDFELGLESQPDVILADYALPQFDGARALQIITERGVDIPFIIVSGVIGDETAVKLMKLGAADYVPKDKLTLLHQAIMHALEARKLRRDRREGEEAMARSEARFRALVENINEIIAIVDKQGVIKYISPSVERILGYRPRELAGKCAHELIHPYDAPQLLTGLAGPILAVDSDPPYEWRLRQKDGSWRTFEVRAAYVLDDPIVGGVVLNAHDITERKRTEQELRYLSTHDALTGLFNRTFFETELARLESGRQFPVTVIVADLDGLKAINDRLGHASGDQALQHVAAAFRSVFRAEDVVARIGGDEFATLLPSTYARAAEEKLEKIRAAMSASRWQEDGPPLRLSLGTATAEKGQRIDDALRRADVSMYREKNGFPREHGLRSSVMARNGKD